MKAFEFDAVVYDHEIYCKGCLPYGVFVHHEDVSPIFADSEWEQAPVCSRCGEVHDYVNVIGEL